MLFQHIFCTISISFNRILCHFKWGNQKPCKKSFPFALATYYFTHLIINIWFLLFVYESRHEQYYFSHHHYSYLSSNLPRIFHLEYHSRNQNIFIVLSARHRDNSESLELIRCLALMFILLINGK